ncbi:hypothetical protein ACIQVN_15225 [Streptomyces cyaneofuscatus]
MPTVRLDVRHEAARPPYDAEHYGSLTVNELITSVLDHYDWLWPAPKS